MCLHCRATPRGSSSSSSSSPPRACAQSHITTRPTVTRYTLPVQPASSISSDGWSGVSRRVRRRTKKRWVVARSWMAWKDCGGEVRNLRVFGGSG